MINSVASFASSDPNTHLPGLTTRLKSEVKRKLGQPSSITLLRSLLYRPTNPPDFQFSRYLSLIVLTDLIAAILPSTTAGQPHPKLVQSGFLLCETAPFSLPAVDATLIDSWSSIFHFLTPHNLNDIAVLAEQQCDESTAPKIYHLISRVRGNQSFADSILFSLQQARKRKLLSAPVLSWLSVLLTRIPCDQEVLAEYFKFGWELRSAPTLKAGATDVITALFPRLPDQAKRASKFYGQRLFHAVTDKKVEQSARGFLRMIRGDTSAARDEPEECLATLGCVGSQGDSYLSTFMSVFFAKVSFAKYRELFRDIIVHLASVNLGEFAEAAVPRFVKLKPTDDRYVVFLMALSFITSPEFVARVPAKGKEAELFEVVRRHFLDSRELLEEATKQPCYFYPDSYEFESAFEEADQLVADFISANNCQIFEPAQPTPRRIQMVRNPYSPISHILLSIPRVFRNEDFAKPEFIRLALSLAAHEDQLISNAAIRLCSTIYDEITIQPFFVLEALKVIREASSSHIRANSLFFLFSKSAFLETELEATLLYSFLSAHRFTRVLALRYLRLLGTLGHSQFLHIVAVNNRVLSSGFKIAVQSIITPPSPTSIELPQGELTINAICESRYPSLWYVFLAQVWNLMIDDGRLDLLPVLRGYLEVFLPNIAQSRISSSSAVAAYLLYFDSFHPDDPAFEHAIEVFTGVLRHGSTEAKRVMVRAVGYLHCALAPAFYELTWRFIESETTIYEDITAAAVMSLTNRVRFEELMPMMFEGLTTFINLLQGYRGVQKFVTCQFLGQS